MFLELVYLFHAIWMYMSRLLCSISKLSGTGNNSSVWSSNFLRALPQLHWIEESTASWNWQFLPGDAQTNLRKKISHLADVILLGGSSVLWTTLRWSKYRRYYLDCNLCFSQFCILVNAENSPVTNREALSAEFQTPRWSITLGFVKL